MKAPLSRLRSVLSLHALLYGEGLLEEQPGLGEEVAELLDCLEAPSPAQKRRLASILALYGLVFGDSALGRSQALLAEVEELLSGLETEPEGRAEREGLRAFRLEDYGRPLESPRDFPEEGGARDLVCLCRGEEVSSALAFRVARASSLRLEAWRPGSGEAEAAPPGLEEEGTEAPEPRPPSLRLSLAGSVCYLLYEPADCPDKQLEFFLREGALAAPFRFEELELFRSSRHDGFYIPKSLPFAFPSSIEIGGAALSEAYYFGGEEALSSLEIFLYRYLNSRVRLPFAQLRPPLERFKEQLRRFLP